MMPHLGVLAEVHPQAALEVFDRDCLIYLGTCVAPRGRDKPGKVCFSYEVNMAGKTQRGEMRVGETHLLPLGLDEKATLKVSPAGRFDCGAGYGVEITREIRGGTVGLILDARGRPLELPAERAACRRAMTEWVDVLQLYPGGAA